MILLLTGAYPYTEAQKYRLEALGYSLLFVQDEREEITFDVSEVDAIVCNGLFMHTDIALFKALKFVQLTRAGLDRVPVQQAYDRGIILQSARGVYSIPMAEWALFKVLEFYKQADCFRNMQADKRWMKIRTIRELNSCTVGVLGVGSVGLEVAKRFNAFGCSVLAVDVQTIAHPSIDKSYTVSEIEQVLPLCDVLVLTVPLTEQTYHWIDKDQLALMKPEAVLVNISRGAVIHEAALIEALQNNQLAYAALDVFEEEPLPENSPLWEMDHVSVSPHNSFVSNQNNERMFDLMYTNLSNFALKQK